MNPHAQPLPDRRRFLAGAAALAAGAAWWAAPREARAAAPAHTPGPLLPAPGTEIRCASTARDVVLRTLTGTGTADIDCEIRLHVAADPRDRTGRTRRLHVRGHHMHGRSAAFGDIEIAEDLEHRFTPASTLRLAARSPRRYELRLVCPRLTVRVERLHVAPLRGRAELPPKLASALTAGRPITLTTVEPLILENTNLPTWHLHHHELFSPNPVRLALPTLPTLPIATLEPFTIEASNSH
ncbi:hypothetical protein ACFQLX_23235 [Streptomyces polyrhachis]|uniref:Secreted protein n=1 Tax=Streptomyces polyrhachis TaxID=1282885 RepID=A0ABW2GJY0_9ACTN